MISADRYLERQSRRIDRALEQCVPANPADASRLKEAMRYSLFGGGKRIRPALLLAASEAVGGAVEPALPFACAVEMVHTYSLIHDDLPAMDDDQLRRGRPTNHVVFGEALAILAGDALLTEAFRVMADAMAKKRYGRVAMQVVSEIAMASGMYGMIGGQAADLRAEGGEADLATVEFIHVRKTGALILAALRAGALLGGARAVQLRSITRYGEYLGLAFQVVDDILDVEGGLPVTGKVQGRDHARKKATYPQVIGIPAAKQRAQDLCDHAVDTLRSFARAADPLRAIARFVAGRACATPVQ